MDANNPYTDAYAPLTDAPAGDALNYAPPPQPAQKKAPPPQPAAQPQQSGLMDRWNEFIDHPEHRAGLMQFAVNMLSGRSLGESIGGAAEATGRNIEKQQEEERYEEAQALKEREEARKERETEYYGIGQRKKSSADTYYEHADYRAQQEASRFARNKMDAWVADLTPDARWHHVKDKFKLESKKDLYDPKHADARQYVADMFAREGAGAGASPGFKAPPNSEARMGGDGKIHYFDKTSHKYLGSE